MLLTGHNGEEIGVCESVIKREREREIERELINDNLDVLWSHDNHMTYPYGNNGRSWTARITGWSKRSNTVN